MATPLTLYVLPTTTGNNRKLGKTQPVSASEAFGNIGATTGYWLWDSSSPGGVHGATQPSPNGDGCEYFTPISGHFVAGKWTVTLKLKLSSSVSGTLIVRLYRRNGSTYTLIGTLTKALTGWITFQVKTLTGTLSASGTFGPTTRLYVDVTYKKTVAAAASVHITVGATSKIVTPGVTGGGATKAGTGTFAATAAYSGAAHPLDTDGGTFAATAVLSGSASTMKLAATGSFGASAVLTGIGTAEREIVHGTGHFAASAVLAGAGGPHTAASGAFSASASLEGGAMAQTITGTGTFEANARLRGAGTGPPPGTGGGTLTMIDRPERRVVYTPDRAPVAVYG